ncbi:hypothetical protein KsCSTR_37090 [Candidatus Kuenenia stuttgartiensis]|uniref:Uncharacterized protein n=1 Tax=Kuenenia stuttgartiensis TaxID=174633 RepID=A0A6G7GU23_KUEST|nr:hypothetical protein KsCSTR_37090 [Candidatus Kuenenia stuttgartiensis]
MRNGFVYDDMFTRTNNYLIDFWAKSTAFFNMAYFAASGELLNYRPVVNISFYCYLFFYLKKYLFCHLARETTLIR